MAWKLVLRSLRQERPYHLLMENEFLPEACHDELPGGEKYSRTHTMLARNQSSGKQKQSVGKHLSLLGILNIGLFFILMGMLVIQGLHFQFDNNRILQAAAFYSPIYNRYPVNMVQKVVAGPLFNEDTLSAQDMILRSYPSNQVDVAWRELTEVGVITISREEVLKLGKDPEVAVKAHESLGFGSDVYLAQIDGQHALHCLNAVRRYAYREHYYPHINTSSTSTGTSPLNSFHRAHLSHCLHILLQTLTCTPSLDLITHKWVEGQDYPFPDFAINKKCVDHGQLLNWEKDNQLSTEQWMEMASRGPAPNEKVFPMTEKFRLWSESEDAKVNGDHVH